MYRRLVTVLLAFAAAIASLSAQKESDEAKRLRESMTVLDEIMNAGDRGIPEAILARAEGIAVFPGTVKAGFIVGGMRGRGVLSGRRNGVWSPPTFMTLTGGSFGLQIGGEAADIVLVIQNSRGVENLVRNQFKLGADIGVAAGPVGREAQAATDVQMRAEILSYSRSRGLFAGVTVNGSTVRADRDANQRFYGTPFTGAQIVVDGKAGTPAPVPDWLQVLNRYARR